MREALRGAAFLLVLAASFTIGLDAPAQGQRVEQLRWTHPNPSEVAGYRVYWGDSPGSYDSQVDTGIPATDASGAYVYSLSFTSGAAIYVAVTAYNAQGLESALSNEKSGNPIGQPGQPQLQP